MKKIAAFLTVCLLLFSLSACAGTAQESEGDTQSQTKASAPSDTAQAQSDTSGSSDAIVVYFSWSGNTQAVAQEIQRQTGADIFEITPQTPYTDDYDTLVDLAQQEQREDARPAISGSVDLSGYDTVYLGYPNWWGDMPMILYTFLDTYDLSGKTVAPFVTSGGSGFSNTLDTIAQLEPNASVTDGLALGSSQADDCSSDVADWLSEIGLAS